jgi:putative methyltransferase (TIGR04325 family)
MASFLKKMQLFLPPVLADFIKKNIGYVGLAPWEYAPQGFKTEVKAGGWGLDSIAALQKEKWPSYASRIGSCNSLGINHESPNVSSNNDPFFHNLLISFAYVFALSAINKKVVKMLDWGGGIGHYGLLAEELVKTTGIEVDYFCYDFEVFNNHGSTLNPTYHYFNDKDLYLDQKFDLLVASSSIWYETDWKVGVDKICRYDAEYIYITRMIFIVDKPSFVAIQRPKTMGYQTEYLFWIINKTEFLQYMESKNLMMVREFEFGPVTPIFKAPEQGTMKGFLFKRI